MSSGPSSRNGGDFFEALVEPITEPNLGDENSWKQVVCITVLAVYSDDEDSAESSILVRDYRIYDKASAKRLVEKIGEWALGAVEDQIASRLNGGGNLLQTPPGSSGISASTTPRYFLRQSRAK